MKKIAYIFQCVAGVVALSLMYFIFTVSAGGMILLLLHLLFLQELTDATPYLNWPFLGGFLWAFLGAPVAFACWKWTGIDLFKKEQ